MVHIPLILTVFLSTIIANGGEMPMPSALKEGDAPAINYGMNWLMASFTVLLVIGLASLTYRFIEKPGRQWLKGKRKPSLEEPPPESHDVVIS